MGQVRTNQRRVERLERSSGKANHPAVVMAVEDGDGVLRDPLTCDLLVPPAGARVIVLTERTDVPQ